MCSSSPSCTAGASLATGVIESSEQLHPADAPFALANQAGNLPMKIRYFGDTDTLHIEFRAAEAVETRDLDEDTLLDIDRDGNICGITIEHARQRTDMPQFSYEHSAA